MRCWRVHLSFLALLAEADRHTIQPIAYHQVTDGDPYPGMPSVSKDQTLPPGPPEPKSKALIEVGW
jgi:hypothetical protein